MTIEQALMRLRAADPAAQRAGLQCPLAEQIAAAGVNFAAVGGPVQDRWLQALAELNQCVRPLAGGPAVLHEGGTYDGCWLESTGTISAEVLSRFAPGVAEDTFTLFARHQRDDGLLPYKVSPEGPAYRQIQIVTPLARSVWGHYRLHHGAESSAARGWLDTMYAAMSRNDAWLARHRDTRGSGAVEAFCTYDTGHDLSPRHWFTPEHCHEGEASRYDPESATIPYLAPDLTANVACQRTYLGRIATELGAEDAPWHRAAQASAAALFEHCFDATEGTFFDRDATGALVRVKSDVLMRVLACEIGDGDFFTAALRRYLMNTTAFLSHYGFTSVAMDDPRFNGDHTRNSWAGPVNFLTQIRAPHAFDHHGHVAELALATRPVLAALLRADRFPQCLDPWSGEAGYTSSYSPALLWLLDAVERNFGILPTPTGRIWFTSMAPTRLGGGSAARATAYARTVAGVHYELGSDDAASRSFRAGRPHLSFPRGWRVETDLRGVPLAVVGLSPRPVTGVLTHEDQRWELTLAANQRAELDGGEVTVGSGPGFVAPRSGEGA
ncbi:MGH1-like glycoside hydrolase domain-containing protein [Pseudactinotalea sp. Z1748]|uniref:MGH1-like glycoside hydrolase domain-containing protein n=1 Tax=Pseudactinotalea sp. Z1748 TaxID=3413027 RepID=UPI003C7DFFD9